MVYDFSIKVLKNTSAVGKQRTDLILTHGVIHQLEVQFPTGCAGIVHLQLFRNHSQVYPSNEGGNFASDGHAISFKDSYPLDFAPFSLTAYSWNTSTDYDHTIAVRLGILPKSALLEYVLPVTTYFMFKGGIT